MGPRTKTGTVKMLRKALFIGRWLGRVVYGTGFEFWRSLVQILHPTYLDLSWVAPSSTPRTCCVNSQLVGLPPVGILNSLCSI